MPSSLSCDRFSLPALGTGRRRGVDRSKGASRPCSDGELAIGKIFPRRLCLLLLLFLALFGAFQSGGQAQEASPDLSPDKAKNLLGIVSDPEVQAWLEAKANSGTEQPEASLAEFASSLEKSIRERIHSVGTSIRHVPDEAEIARETILRDVNSGRPGLVAGILAILIAIGCGAEWAVRRALARVSDATAPGEARQAILFETAALLTFALASAGSFIVLDWPPLLHRVVLTILLAIFAFRVLGTAARLFLEQTPSAGELPEQFPQPSQSRMAARFWLRRIRLISGFVCFGWAIVSIMPLLGFSREVATLVAFLFVLGILVTSIEVVWRRPDGRGPLVVSFLLTLFLIVLWGIWVAGMLGVFWLGIFALILPAALRVVEKVSQAIAAGSRRDGAIGVVMQVVIVRGARALVIAAAVAWLAHVWRVRAASFTDNGMSQLLVMGVLNGILVLLVADLLWQLSKGLIEYRINLAPVDGSNTDEIARTGRLRTLLPIFRNALAVFIVAIAVLTILAGLGVQILPLIAGAGIFGIAIGFGSQTLVKDVLSGVFYMLDDAFRVGEYIQSGSYKGTVESFSLRSVRLRHHRGPVFTVPFGDLGAVQNLSRDWVIEKMTITVTYDSDVDLARKLIKKIGQDLAVDPEYAADTIQPLKMQGVDDFGDNGIVLRMKLTTKPGAQFPIKRAAYVRIKKAFDENGVRIAVPTVHVEGGTESAGAAHQAIRLNQAAKAATGEAQT